MSRLNLSTQLSKTTQGREHKTPLPVAAVPEVDENAVIAEPLMVELYQNGSHSTLEHLADTQMYCEEQALLALCQLIESPYDDEHDPIGKYAFYRKRQQCSGQKLKILLELRIPSQNFPVDLALNYIHQLENFEYLLSKFSQYYDEIHPQLVEIIDNECVQLTRHKHQIIQLVQSCTAYQGEVLAGPTHYYLPQSHPEEVYVSPMPQKPDNPAHSDTPTASSGELLSHMPVVPVSISPVNTHQCDDSSSFFLAKSPDKTERATSTHGSVATKLALSTNVSAVHEQFTVRFIANLLAGSANTADPDEPTAKSRCLFAGEASCLALFATDSTNGGENALQQELAEPVSATPTTPPHAGIAKYVPVKATRFGSLPVRQRKTPTCSGGLPGPVLASLLSERNHCITPALAPTVLTARYHVPP